MRPTEINLHKGSKTLEVVFDNGDRFEFSCEYLRVYSPSAEVQGHGPGQEVLQTGKENVNIDDIEAVGSYAVTLHFDDGHSTGIYSWELLHKYGTEYEQRWQNYLDRLRQAAYERHPAERQTH